MNPSFSTACRRVPGGARRPHTERRWGWFAGVGRRAAPLVAGVGALLAPSPGQGQDYHCNDLTPAGAVSGKLSAASGGRQVGGAVAPGSSYSHAYLLVGNALSGVDLHPTGYYYSMATSSDDARQGGWGYSVAGGVHALLWSGSAASVVDLHPSGYNFSYCLGVHGGEQVGYAQNQSYFVTASHAMRWLGSAGTAIDLHPAGYAFSRALGCRDGEQVGYVSSLAYPDGESLGYHTTSRAMRWAGSAGSAVNLHPAGFDASEALCTSGSQQGGWGYLAAGTTHQHALLWSGSAESVVDLHPAGYTDSRVNAVSAIRQVGEGWVGAPGGVGSVRHALAWSGSAESVVDLNQYLPAGYTQAVATGVDEAGNIVGYAYNTYVAGLAIPPGAIAVMFQPGGAPPSGLASFAVTPDRVEPGAVVQGEVVLGAPAPAGGVSIGFLSTAPDLVATPPSILVAEGETTATFPVPTGGTALTVPTTLKLYATDGSVSRAATLGLAPVVRLAGLSVNPVEGGFSTWGSVVLSIPAQAGGAVVALASGDPALVAVAASVTVPSGHTSANFPANTAPVGTAASVPVTATYNGQTLGATVALSPAPVVALAGLQIPGTVGGQTVVGTVSLNNFPRNAAGATVTLTSGDSATLEVPSSVVVPQGALGVSFPVITHVVSGPRGVSVRAAYNGTSWSTTVRVEPIPVVTITQADFLLDTMMFKVQATTTYTNSILTYGGDPAGGPFGTMQFEKGVWKGSIVLDAAPALATVWSSVGGEVTVPVTVKTGLGGNSSGGGGGGGGGGGSSPSASARLSVKTSGKGTVSTSPSGTSFPVGTVVTLTATPAAGSPWMGWSGDATGSSRTVSVTLSRDLAITANFR